MVDIGEQNVLQMKEIRDIYWQSYNDTEKKNRANVDVEEFMKTTGQTYDEMTTQNMQILLCKFGGCLYHVISVLNPLIQSILTRDSEGVSFMTNGRTAGTLCDEIIRIWDANFVTDQPRKPKIGDTEFDDSGNDSEVE